jgi:three-Cys-motif partner protein
MEWSEQFFFTRRRLTSKLKHLVLQGYVKEFAYHLGSVRRVVYYVDGFAGAGTYSDAAIREDGSPLLIAKLAQQIKTSSRPFDLRCLNVESNRRRFASLESATEPFRPNIVENNYQASFVDVIPNILNRIADAPAFFFIDPFGTKDIAFNDLLPVFTRASTTEVLITLHTDGIAKKAGWFARENAKDPAVRAMARKFTAHLAAALDVPLEQLRSGWLDTGEKGDTEAFENRVLRYYLRRLRSKRTRFKFAKPFRVLYYDPNELTEKPVCFHLVFATSHEKGLFVMNDVMADALATFYREVYSDSFRPTFQVEYERQFGTEAVRREIQQSFSSKPFTIDQVKLHCMQDTDYLLSGAEYRSLILELARTGELKKLGKGVASNAHTRFELGRSPTSRSAVPGIPPEITRDP